MPIKELFFLFDNSVNLLMKSEELLRVDILSTTAMSLGEAASHAFAVIGACSKGVLEVVPVVLLLLLELLLFRQLSGKLVILGLRLTLLMTWLMFCLLKT